MLRVTPKQLELESADQNSRPENVEARAPVSRPTTGSKSSKSSTGPAPQRRAAADLLATEGALLTGSHLREPGLERRAVDAIFRALPVVAQTGRKWALIGSRVGQRSLSVTADTYTHVLLDDRELDHSDLAARLGKHS